MTWLVTVNGDDVVVALDGELDVSNVDAVAATFASTFTEQPKRITLELRALRYCDSAGLRCLLDASSEATRIGCALVAQNPSRSVARLLDLTGVSALLLDDADPAARAG